MNAGRRRGGSRPALRLRVQLATRCRRVPPLRQFTRWAHAALARPAEITLRVVGEREGARLNRDYRGRRHATNVLAFCYEGGERLAGDIVLCAPVIAREALAQHKGLESHYAHLTVHALLHLQGFEHDSARGARVMEAREVELLHGLGYPDPYLEIPSR